MTTSPDEGHIIDGSIHRHVREINTESRLAALKVGSGARKDSLRRLLDESTDTARSNPFATAKSYSDHRAAETIFALRSHSIGTQSKLHAKSNWSSNLLPPAVKSYYLAAYPSPACHFCARHAIAGPTPTENTAHIVACPHCEEAQTIKTQAWHDIRQRVAESRDPNANAAAFPPPTALPAFGCATQQDQDAVATYAHLHASKPGLKAVAAFPQDWGNEGLIPAALPLALRELGVLDPGKVASDIAAILAHAIHDCVRARARRRAKDIGQRRLYRRHVLGIADGAE